MTTTFLLPFFNKSEKDKINNRIDVLSDHVLLKRRYGNLVPAISSQGFPANRDGTYVFVTKIAEINPKVEIGFTSTKTIDARSPLANPGVGRLNGCCLSVDGGNVGGGTGDRSGQWAKPRSFSDTITDDAEEVIAVLTISENGLKRCVQFILDGNEGPVHELAKTDFENKNGGNVIFPVLTMYNKDDQLECIPFNQVKSRSPKINKLMKEFGTSEKKEFLSTESIHRNEQEPQKKAQIKKTVKKVAASKSKVATTKKPTNSKKKVPATKKKAAKKAIKNSKKAGKKIAKK